MSSRYLGPGLISLRVSDNLQRKYGELSGEIIIVEIAVKEIQEILSSNYRNSTAHQHPTTPLSSPTIPVTSFQKPSSQANSRVFKTLGISLCGNKDLNQMAVLVCGLRPGSIAEVDGRITVGDQLLEVEARNCITDLIRRLILCKSKTRRGRKMAIVRE